MDMKTHSSRIIIRHWTDTILLVHNSKYNVWELPGGTLEEGETPCDAALRELTSVTLQLAKKKRKSTRKEYAKAVEYSTQPNVYKKE